MKPEKPKKGIKKNPFLSLDRIVQVNMLSYIDLDNSSASVNFTIAHINDADETVADFGMSRKLYYEINNQTKVDKNGNHIIVDIDPVDIDPVDNPTPNKEVGEGEFDYWMTNIKKVGLEGSLIELIAKLDAVNYFD